MIGALAEFERSLISERTRAGMSSARLRGSKIGRPPALTFAERERARALLLEHSAAEVAALLKIHVRTLRKYLKLDTMDT